MHFFNEEEPDIEPEVKKIDFDKIKKEKENKKKKTSKQTLNILMQKNLNIGNVSNWIISEEDEEEINNQIEEEREKWNQRMEQTSNSFTDFYDKRQPSIGLSTQNIKNLLIDKMDDALLKFEELHSNDKFSPDKNTYKSKQSHDINSFHSSKSSI